MTLKLPATPWVSGELGTSKDDNTVFYVRSADKSAIEVMTGAPDVCLCLSADVARLIANSPEMLEALKAYQTADDYHANCDECEGSTEAPELCGLCFPYFDTARLKMRAVLEKVR